MPSFTFIRDTYAQSAYSRRVHKGSRTVRFINASDLLVNLLILPHRQHLVWYEHVKGQKFGLRGTHGGLSADEMLIPMAVANLAALQ